MPAYSPSMIQTKHPIAVAILAFTLLLLTGCSVNPTYTVRVINDSRTTLNARIEHRPKFAEPITLGSINVKPGEERTLGPVESPPLERVVLLIGVSSASISAPESFVIKRGSYTARISRGTSTSWAPFEVSLLKD